jgi:DUF883 C-terminal glycine zipper region
MDKRTEDVTSQLGDNLNEIREELSERTQEIRDAIGNYVDEHPFQSIGIAFGIGYLLSGALFSRTTLRAATFGGRFVLGGFLKQLVAGIGPGMLAAALGREQHEESTASGGGNGNRARR